MNLLLGALPPLPVVRYALGEVCRLATRGGVSARAWLGAAVPRLARPGARACGGGRLATHCAARS